MNKKVLIALSLMPGMAQAVICKSVDADGVVAYTDVPAAECQQRVKLPPNSTYAPRKIPSAFSATKAARVEAKKPFQRYDSIEIVQPEANGTVRNNEGNVGVVVALEPALQQGHVIKVFIDGRAVPGEFDGSAIELQGVNRGTHSLRAVVSDGRGKRLGDSASLRFTLRKVGLYDNAQSDKNPPGEPGKPVNPIEPTPENPIAPVPTPLPNQPVNGGISSTPGQTNPAFKPNYGR